MGTLRRMASFDTIGLVGRVGNPMVVETVAAVAAYLNRAGVRTVVEDDTARMVADGALEAVPRERLGKDADLIIVVGGDGSILGVARDLAHTGVPVLGVNRGGLGFLADVSPDQIEPKIAAVLNGDFSLEAHFLLESKVVRDGVGIDGSAALNDVVVDAGTRSRMMDFELYVDGEFVYDQRSDGLIVSTPTGSTAYALSAGGPIMHPSLDAIVIVPMFPHTLTSRPLVVRGDAKLKIIVGASADAPELSCDSQVDISLRPDDEVRIEKYPHSLQLVYPRGHSFYESCRRKLDWASRLGRG